MRGFFASFIDKIEIREEDLLVVYRPEAMVKGTNQAVVPSNRNWLPDQYRLGTAEPMVTRLALVVELPNKWKKAA